MPKSFPVRARSLLTPVVLLSLAGGLARAESAPVAPQSRPNIVLIVSDDHGPDELGCYGNTFVRTPNLDRLAADGTRFTAAFCTTSSCSPSRSVILTGQHNHRNGAYGLEHQEHHFRSFAGVRGVSVRLAEAGYRTARIGKFHLAPEQVYAFQTVLSLGAANDPETIGRSPVEMAEISREVIESDDPAPFFLYFAPDDPHRSNGVSPDGAPTFDTFPQPNPFGNRASGFPGVENVAHDPASIPVPRYLPDNPQTRLELAEYYQSINRLDQGIGRLMNILRDSGKYENTVVIYLSDNGPAFPGAKTNLYEPGLRLPLIVRAPGRAAAGAVQPAMVSWVDIAPTILDYAGVASEEGAFDGRSFRAGVDGGPLAGWDRVFASHTFHQITMYYPMRSVRTARHKLIVNLADRLDFPMARDLLKSPTWIANAASGSELFGRRRVDRFIRRDRIELYDLETDPDEVINLADDPAHQTLKAELIAELQQFQKRTKDPWFHKWSYE